MNFSVDLWSQPTGQPETFFRFREGSLWLEVPVVEHSPRERYPLETSDTPKEMRDVSGTPRGSTLWCLSEIGLSPL